MLLTIMLWAIGYCVFAWVLVFYLFMFTDVLRGAHPGIIIWAPVIPFHLGMDWGGEYAGSASQVEGPQSFSLYR